MTRHVLFTLGAKGGTVSLFACQDRGGVKTIELVLETRDNDGQESQAVLTFDMRQEVRDLINALEEAQEHLE